MIDGEVVALDAGGRPSFNALQNAAPSGTTIVYYVFDLMMLAGRDLTGERLEVRRQLLEREVLPRLAEPVRYLGELRAPLRDLIHSVKEQSFEGLVAKRRDSRYEPGLRSGAWMKMRVNQGQEFVIGGYTLGTRTFDALVIGYYEKGRLLFAARTRAGFTPATRQQVFRAFRGLETPDCPFANLPEARSGRWGEGLTKAKMADCRWLKPVLVGPLRVPGVDRRRSPPARAVRRPARRQAGATRDGASSRASEEDGRVDDQAAGPVDHRVAFEDAALIAGGQRLQPPFERHRHRRHLLLPSGRQLAGPGVLLLQARRQAPVLRRVVLADDGGVAGREHDVDLRLGAARRPRA